MKFSDNPAQSESEAASGPDKSKATSTAVSASAAAKSISKKAPKRDAKSGAGKQPPGSRLGTKQAKLIALLSRGNGTTIDQLAKALDWQKHTVRGAISGALKKKLGLKVVTQKNAAGILTYRIR